MNKKPKTLSEVLHNKSDREIFIVSCLLGAVLFIIFCPLNYYFILWFGACLMFSLFIMKTLKQVRDEK